MYWYLILVFNHGEFTEVMSIRASDAIAARKKAIIKHGPLGLSMRVYGCGEREPIQYQEIIGFIDAAVEELQ